VEVVAMEILVIEDDADLLEILAFALHREGYHVTAARDGASGLQQWRNKEPAMILLDIDLPKVDGWEVCRQIRSEGNTPIVMLTAATAEADRNRGLELGANDYIVKPFGARELLARMRAVMRRATEPLTEI
jgi:DNA-binding response OmpR family regulator